MGEDPSYFWSKRKKEWMILKSKNGVDSSTTYPKQTKTMQNYLQNIKNWSNKWLDPLKGPHNAITEIKGAQIKANLSEPLLENNNYPKKAKAEYALLKIRYRDLHEWVKGLAWMS